jgi:hypothetical protein
MEFDQRTQRALTTGGATTHSAAMPGKHTLTECLAAQRPGASAGPGTELAVSGTAASAPAPLPVLASSCPRPTLQMLFGVNRAAARAAAEDPARMQATAEALPPRPAASGSLPPEVQARMESAFDTDFSSVRVREDHHARELGALAYARGEEIVFQPGKYDPTSRSGQELIGHELAHVVQQREGRVPGGGAQPAIQRYRDVTTNNGRFQVSDGRSMMTRSDEDPNKKLFAKLPALQRAQSQLARAGSFIHLQAASIMGDMARVEPRFLTPPSQDRKLYQKPKDKKGGDLSDRGPRMGMPSDCNNSARMIMGIVHPPEVTHSAPQLQNIERPVLRLGGQERVVDLPPQPLNGTKGSHETAGIVALSVAMTEYRQVVGERMREYPQSVHAFLDLTRMISGPSVSTWSTLQTLRTHHAELYSDFTAWAGLDSSVMPQVGDALVAWRLAGDKSAVNRRAYNSMAEVLRTSIEDQPAREKIIQAITGRLSSQYLTLLGVLADILTEVVNLTLEPELGPNRKPNPRRTAADRRHKDLQIQEAKLQKDLDGLNAARDALGGFNGQNGLEIARAALRALGIDENTSWSETQALLRAQDKGDDDLVGERVLGDDAFADLSQAVDANGLWNKHWGGVVMTEPSSGDYVTLENDASTEEDFGKTNAEWRFAMNGSRQEGQSFHEKNEQTGDFGDRAAVVRFRAPGDGWQRGRKLPELSDAEDHDQLERNKKLIPRNLTFNPTGCGLEARRDEPHDDHDQGGPPPLFKASGEVEVNTDPALEAEADAKGAAAARHDEDDR